MNVFIYLVIYIYYHIYIRKLYFIDPLNRLCLLVYNERVKDEYWDSTCDPFPNPD